MTRDEAIQVLQDKIDNDTLFKYERESFEIAIEALSAEAVHDEWIVTEHCSNEYGFRKWIEIECPLCGERPTYENLDNMNFCPNCGARMYKAIRESEVENEQH